jgi:hypothetical protein
MEKNIKLLRFCCKNRKTLNLKGTYFCDMHNRTSDDSVIKIFKEMTLEQREKCLEALKESTCPECGSINFRQIDGEVVCTGCGLVQSRLLQHLGTNDYSETSSPVTNLAFGRGLGDTLGSSHGRLGNKDFFRVLAKAPAGREDIGLRVRFMKVMSTQNEHPITHKLLEVGSKLSREFGKGEDAFFFAHHFGTLLRRVGFSVYLLKTKGEAVRAKWLAVATFVYVWQLMERDRGLRKEIEYEEFFPGHNRKALTSVEPTKYKVDRTAWDFVHFEVNRHALWVAHERMKSEGELIADVNRLCLDETAQSSTFLVDGHEGKKRAPKCMKGIPYSGSRVNRENLSEYERQLLAVFDDEEGGEIPMRKSTVEMHVCSSVPVATSLRGGTLANVLNAIQQLEQFGMEGEVEEEQVRAVVGRLGLPGRSAKKRRQKTYDIYAFLVSVLKIKAGLPPDLFIGSVILRRLVEVYKDPTQLQMLPWATCRPYRIVVRALERLPLTLKSS